VAAAVRDLGLRHTQAPVVTDGFLPRMRELVRYHDAPVYTISYYAHWLLMELVAGAGYRVAVSGTAADELFTGYYDHHLAYLREVSREPAVHAAARAGWEEHVRPLVRNPHLRDPELYVRDPDFRDHLVQDGDDLSDHLTRSWSEPFTERRFTSDLLRNRMLNELADEVVPVILHEDDLNAMYFSVENRSPYLDRNLVEFAYSIPTRHLVRDGYAKAVLRDAVRGVAPDHVVDNRRKVGFNAPILGFLDAADPHVREELLADGPIFDYVQRDRVAQLLEEPELPNSKSKFLFSFVTAKLFLEEFA
jgi:asparagine synthase (glutamine-hydrolysing)